MKAWRYVRSNRHDVVTIPTVWLGFLLSLLVHIVALWFWAPRIMHNLSAAIAEQGKTASVLAVELQPQPTAPAISTPASPAPPPTTAESTPKPRAPPKTLATRRSAPPPPVALNKHESEPAIRITPPPVERAAPPPVEKPAPAVAPKPSEPDLASYIAARKRERGESPSSAGQTAAANVPPAESDIERRNKIVAANLGLNAAPSFGYDPRNAGGIFQIQHMDFEYADFYYFGLNKDIGRNTKQLIEVKRGTDGDIRIAVVRKMIAIIRDNASGDFVWLSRHGPVTMSARVSNNAELEQFILSDVFPDARLER